MNHATFAAVGFAISALVAPSQAHPNLDGMNGARLYGQLESICYAYQGGFLAQEQVSVMAKAAAAFLPVLWMIWRSPLIFAIAAPVAVVFSLAGCLSDDRKAALFACEAKLKPALLDRYKKTAANTVT